MAQGKTDGSGRKPARNRGRPSTLDETRALDAAVHAFWRDGYQQTDLDDVAASAGTTKPSLYRRFGSKEDLFLAALRHYAHDHGARPVAAFLGERDIAAAVRAFFRSTVEGQTAPGLPSGCLFACTAAPLAERQPAVGTFLSEALQTAADTLAQRFEAAASTGELRPDFPSRASARLMLDAMQGLALRAREGADRAKLLADAEIYAATVIRG